MPRLIERTVQNVAQDKLRKRYVFRARFGRIFSKIEVKTKKEHGGKRADGFLAFKHWLWGTYVVSMEAKSFKTLPAMKPYRDNGMWFKNSVNFGFQCALVLAVSVLFYDLDFESMLVYSGLAFGWASVLYAFLTHNSFKHKKVAVLDQLAQYPANEQWLAFSQDSVSSLKEDKWDQLIAICRANGIGIILVGQRKRTTIISTPSRHLRWFDNFLRFYSIEKEVKTFLN